MVVRQEGATHTDLDVVPERLTRVYKKRLGPRCSRVHSARLSLTRRSSSRSGWGTIGSIVVTSPSFVQLVRSRKRIVCTSEQPLAGRTARIIPVLAGPLSAPMPLIVGALIVLIALVLLAKGRVPGGVNPAKLGWMSEQWVADYRATHRP